MDAWTWPAYVGVIGGLFAFALVFVPTLLIQMRRYGSLNLRRLLGAGALAVYAVALVAYTLLPLPSGDLTAWCTAHGVDGAQLRPFQFVDDIWRETSGLGLRPTLTSRATLQVAFNVLLFVPLGVFVRRYQGRGVGTATVVSLGLSLFVEATQYTGMWGLLGCSYRVADVDDVMANTLGGLLGALIAPVVLAWMPQSRDLARDRLRPRPVRIGRRWVGMAVDAAAFSALGVLLTVCWRLAQAAATGDGLEAGPAWPAWVVGWVLPWLVVFAVPVLGGGASWGQRAVWLAPVRAGGVPSLPRRLARAWLVGGLWGALQVVQAVPGLPEAWADGCGAAVRLLALAAVLSVPLTRTRRGLSGVLGGVRLADVRARTRPPGCARDDGGYATGVRPAAGGRPRGGFR